MKDLSPKTFFDLKDYKHASLFKDCLFPWQALAKIHGFLLNSSLGKIEVDVPKTAYLVHPELISIGAGTVIEPGAYIKGPCILGNNCTVRHGAYIRGDFIAGDECVIGHDTEVKNSLFLNGAHAAHFAYVGDSILGNRVNLGAGTICANLKLDNAEIIILIDGKRIKTGLRKFGAVIGDLSQTGCNTVLNPGTLLGKNVACYPCSNFGGYVEANHLVKPANSPIVVPRKLGASEK